MSFLSSIFVFFSFYNMLYSCWNVNTDDYIYFSYFPTLLIFVISFDVLENLLTIAAKLPIFFHIFCLWQLYF